MTDLVSLDRVAAWLSVSSVGERAILQTMITSYSQWIRSWLSRDLSSQTYTLDLDGNGGKTLLLPEWPVSAVSALSIDGVTIPAAASVTGSGYRFSDQALFVNGYSFTRGFANVHVVFTAGFATIPEDLAQACLELVSMRYKEKDRIGHQSKSLAGETVSFSLKDMPDSVKTILMQYRRVTPL